MPPKSKRTPTKKAVSDPDAEGQAPVEQVSVVVRESWESPTGIPAGSTDILPIAEQWLLLSCGHGEIAYLHEAQDANVGGGLYPCRRCGTNRFIRQVVLSQPFKP